MPHLMQWVTVSVLLCCAASVPVYEFRGALFNGTLWIKNGSVVCPTPHRCRCLPQEVKCEWLCVSQQITCYISAPLYILQMWVWIRQKHLANKDFRSEFFTFCISTGVMDIGHMIHWYVWEGWPQMGAPWADTLCNMKHLYLSTYIKSFYFYFLIGTLLGMMFMTINRFTALIWPIRQTQIWRKNVVRVSLVIQFGVPLVYVIPVYLNYWSHAFIDENFYTKILDQEKFEFWIHNTLLFAMSGLFLPLFVVLYLLMFIRLLVHKPKSTQRRVNKVRPSTEKPDEQKPTVVVADIVQKPEVRLALAGFIICFTFGFNLSIYIFIRVTKVYDNLYGPYNLTKFFWICCNPWLMAVFSKATRQGKYSFRWLSRTIYWRRGMLRIALGLRDLLPCKI